MNPRIFKEKAEAARVDPDLWQQFSREHLPGIALRPCVTEAGELAAIYRGFAEAFSPLAHTIGYMVLTAPNTDPDDDTMHIGYAAEYGGHSMKSAPVRIPGDTSYCTAWGLCGELYIRTAEGEEGVEVVLPDVLEPRDTEEYTAREQALIRVNDSLVVSSIA